MRCPRRGEVFMIEMDTNKYMSLMDKGGDIVRCLSDETKKQTTRSKKHITQIFTGEESQVLLPTFFEGGAK
jgi:hypothetical protein